MTSNQIKKLNSYPEWHTILQLNAVKAYVNSINLVPPVPVYPPNIANVRQIKRYDKKFGHDFEVHNNTLYYRPKPVGHIGPALPRINLEVIVPTPPVVIQTALKAIYDNPREGLGTGLQAFYSQVCSKYLGITRAVSSEFLKKQGDYQITRVPQKVVNRPILAKTSNERWGCDCVYLLKYGQPTIRNRNDSGKKQYLFVVVDYFSKKVWARAMTHPITANKTATALASIIAEAHTYPHLLQSDNGSEFRSAFATYMNAHPEIHWIKTTSYSPQANGLCERMNGTLRKIIKAGVVKNNDFEWANHLQTYVDNMNNQISGKTGYKPSELWEEGYTPPPGNLQPIVANDHSTIAEVRQAVQGRLLNNAKAQLARGRKPGVFQVGDDVRIKLSVIDADSRARNKGDGTFLKKWNAINYTPAKYRVMSVLHPDNINNVNMNDGFISRPTYTLNAYVNGVANLRLLAGPHNLKYFFGSDLLLVPPNSTASAVPDWERSRVINRMD